MLADNQLRYIRCWAGDRVYALDMQWVRTIQRADRLHREAYDSGQIGWLEMNRQRVAVWSLAERLGETAVSEQSTQRIIVLNDNTYAWGLLVERVSQVETAVSDAIHLIPSVALNPAKPYFDRVIRRGDQLLLLLSPDCLHPERVIEPPSSNGDLFPATAKYPSNLLPHLKQTQQSFKTQKGQIILFKLPEQMKLEQPLSFMLSISQVSELLSPLPIMPVPGAPDVVKGLVNWRKHVVPVIDLANYLDVPVVSGSNRMERARLMIVRTIGTSEFLAIPVDASVQVVRLPLQHAIDKQPLPLKNDHILASFQTQNEKLILPDLQQLAALGI